MQVGMNKIGERIEERRRRLGLTQEQLANRSGIDQSQVNRVINGKIKNPPYLYEMSKVLETNMRWLKTGLGSADSAEEEVFLRAAGNSLVTGYKGPINPTMATQEAAEIMKIILMTTPDTQKRLSDWLSRLTADNPPASSGERAEPKKNDNP